MKERKKRQKRIPVALYLSICEDLDDDDDLGYFEDNGEEFKADVRQKIADVLEIDTSALE